MLLRLLAPMLLLFTLVYAEEQQAPPPSLVETVTVKSGSVNPLQTFVGTLYYDQKSAIAAESAGRVQKVSAREGAAVNKGAPLLTLDSTILRATLAAKDAAIRAQQAELENQVRDLNRSRALLERKSISQSSYDAVFYQAETMRARIDAAKSERLALKIELDKTVIRAPFKGIISARNTEMGEWVAKGATVAELVNPDSIEARVNLPAELIRTVKTARRFDAAIDGTPLQITVKSVIPVADRATRTFPVELRLPAVGSYIEGMRIDISVPMLTKSEALLVPRDAVIRRFAQVVVFAVNDGKAMMLPVKVIGYDGNRAAIAGQGLRAGMSVVVKGNERIFPNMPVMVKGTP